MSSTGSLEFEANIDLSKFESRIQVMERYIRNVSSASNDTWKSTKEGIDGVGNSAGSAGGKIKNLVTELLPIASVGAGVAVLKSLVSGIIEVRAEFEKYQAVLTNTLGSQEAANRVMGELTDFAARTPFALSELTGAYVKLTNYGLQPTMEQMRQYGDLASSVGKGFDQLAEAAADAVTGEFERLKEFGIKAAKEGENITFTFKEQATVVKNNAKDIQTYLASLGDMKGVSGSMDAISKTLGGQISNLKDNIDKMFNSMGASTGGAMSTAISGISTLVEHYEEVIKVIGILVGTYGAYKTALMVTAALQKAQSMAGAVSAWLELAKGIKTAKDAQIAFSLATKASPVGLIVAAISGLVLAFTLLHKSTKTATEAQEEFNNLQKQVADYDNTTDLIDKYNVLASKQDRTNEEQAEYNKLIEQLSRKIPEATAKMDEHGKVVGLNAEKLKEYSEAQKKAINISAEGQLTDAEKALAKLEAKAKKQQEIFMNKTYTELIPNQFGGVQEVTRERSEKEMRKAADKYQELLGEINKYKETIDGLEITLGKKVKVEVTDETDTAANKNEVKKTISEQIEAINKEIANAEGNLKKMRLSTSIATPEEIEAQEKSIKDLKSQLETLTGISQKSTSKADKSAIQGTIKYLEEQLKKLQDKTGTFLSPEAEAENAKKIEAILDQIALKNLEVQQLQRDNKPLEALKESSNAAIKTQKELTIMQRAYERAGLKQGQKLTEEEKKRLNYAIEKATLEYESNEYKLEINDKLTNQQKEQLELAKERAEKEQDSYERIQDNLETARKMDNALAVAFDSLGNMFGGFNEDFDNMLQGTVGVIDGFSQLLDEQNLQQKASIEDYMNIMSLAVEFNKLMFQGIDWIMEKLTGKKFDVVNDMTKWVMEPGSFLTDKLGFSTDDIRESLTDGIIEGFEEGKQGLVNFNDSFYNLLKNSVRNALLNSLNEKDLKAFQEKVGVYMEGGLTEEELEQLKLDFADLEKDTAEKLKLYSSIFNVNLSETTETGKKGSISGMTERTAELLEGRFNSIQFNVIAMKTAVDKQLLSLQKIEYNTSFNHYLETINDKMKVLNNIDQTLMAIKNGSSTPENYGVNY